MRNTLFLLILLAISASLYGQNLVPNGSFEELRNLPVKPNPNNSFEFEPTSGFRPFQINLNDWFAATNTTPDLRIKSPKSLNYCKTMFDDCDAPTTPQKAFNYITIGNFFSNEQTNVVVVKDYKGSRYTPPYAYYLIDDVRVWQEGDIEDSGNEITYDGTKLPAKDPIILQQVEFDHDQWNLKAGSTRSLEKLIDLLNQHSSIAIRITGHTDNSGGKLYNQELSEKRAKSVLDFLVSAGISRDRLAYEGKGDNEPLVENTSERNRQTNRRVEFTILSDGI